MGKVVAGVIVGYLVMFVIVFVLLAALYSIMGADGAFKEGSFEPTGMWLVIMFAVGLAAALVGGFACAAIAPGTRAPLALAVLVLALGALSAVPAFMPPDPATPTERTGEVGNLEAMASARNPPWVAVMNPLIGVIGVLVGARLRSGEAR